MPSCQRIDTSELKSQLFRRLGRQRAEEYFYYLKKLLNMKISKLEFNKLCYNTIGKENLVLHNMVIRSILNNACLALGPPSKETITGDSRTTKMSRCGGTLLSSPPRTKSINSREQRLADRPSPLGANAKMPAGHNHSSDIQRSREQRSAPEVISVGSKALLSVASVEDGEEVEQIRGSPSVQSRSPLRPPFGIQASGAGFPRKSFRRSTFGVQFFKSDPPFSCYQTSELPDTRALMVLLRRKLEAEGLSLSVDCANLLNHGLDAYLRRLIKPYLELARARSTFRGTIATNKSFHILNGLWQVDDVQIPNQSYNTTSLDFRVAMESNPQLLGVDWPVQLEKVCLRLSE